MSRTIGIRHRRKKTAENEARPTQVAILDQMGQLTSQNLENDTAELDWLLGRFPIDWRKVEADEDVNSWLPRHCKWRRAKRDEDVSEVKTEHMRQGVDAKGMTALYLLTHIPTQFDGLKAGDKVGMVLGGSGDRFAAALSRRGEEVGAGVFRLPPFVLKDQRGEVEKDDDHAMLAVLLQEQSKLFYLMRRRDRDAIRIKTALQLRMDAMKARIGCEQRIQQSFVGKIFLTEEGYYPEGEIEELAQNEQANDAILQNMQKDEKRRQKELEKAVHEAPIWEAIFAPIVGCGPRLAAAPIAFISDIRRFWVEADPVAMQILAVKCQELEHDGKLVEDRTKVADRITKTTTFFQVLQMVRSWKRANGKEAEAVLLDQAIACHQKRHKLRRQTRQRGMAKLKKFCGVHVLTIDKDGNLMPKNRQFPRRRTGTVANWNPKVRQALYLLGEQFNRRPDSEWGKKLLEYKLKLRQVHPEVIVENGKKRYTNGHIHKMAIWRTLTKFVEKLFTVWTRLELDQQRRERALLPMQPNEEISSECGSTVA